MAVVKQVNKETMGPMAKQAANHLRFSTSSSFIVAINIHHLLPNSSAKIRYFLPPVFLGFRAVVGGEEMASTSKASLIVAASMGAVEALKDQAGLCRWNYALRSLHQRAKSSVGSLSQATRMATSIERRMRRVERAKRTEQTLDKIMYFN
ncbi:hypothetical protein COCNU_scaffold006919G000040 [Cocos nucifera]|nr:hypothetical protein [Cocos nucifera]